MGSLGILCFLIFLEKSWGQDPTYVISAPKVFHAGTSENVVIQVYGYSKAFDATISIKSYPDKNFSYDSGSVHLSPENKFQNSAILTVQLVQFCGRQNSVSYVYLEIASSYFSKLQKIPVICDNAFLFIQTDKSVYTPNQSVKVRVYSLNDEMKPSKRDTILTFIDPQGSEVDIIEENDDTEIFSFPDFKIPPNPKCGVWMIKAKYKEDFSTTGTTHFEIKEYDESSKEILRPRRDLQQKIEEKAAKYKHAVPRKCCFDGARLNYEETCEQRVARLTIGPFCIRAFNECCILANQLRDGNSFKHKHLHLEHH